MAQMATPVIMAKIQEKSNWELGLTCEFNRLIFVIVFGQMPMPKGGSGNSPQFGWSFTDSVLFCFTIITTIGYGNVAPKTFMGQLFCILYALIGS
jgi:hypothetical protein